MTERTTFTSATLYDGRGAKQSNMTVVVEGERILSVDAGKSADGGRHIDLRGKTIMPGMTVGHWHGEFKDLGPPTFSHGRGGTFLGTEQPPAILAIQAMQAMQAALQSGVMRVVSGSCSNNLDAQMKMAVDTGLFDGPEMTACSRYIVTTSDFEDRGKWWQPPVPMQDGIRRIGGTVFADGPERMARAVREEMLFGAEILKILPNGGHGVEWTASYRGLSPAELRAVIETAHERDARVRAHVTTRESILECIEAGVDIIDHADFLDEACIEAMVKHGTFFIPSLLFSKMISGAAQGLKPDMSAVSDLSWLNMQEMLPKANDAGVMIVPGDDFGVRGMEHGPGAYARELEVYVKDMGIPAVDVIRWATINGAKLAGQHEDSGTIEPGKAADFIVVDGDPGADIAILQDPATYLTAIVKRGRFIKDMLEAPATSARDARERKLETVQ